MLITVTGPAGGRPAAPVAARIPLGRIGDDQMMGLVEVETGRPMPVQVDSRGRLCWIQDELPEGEVRRYRLNLRGLLADATRVVVHEHDGANAALVQHHQSVAMYHGASSAHRPFLGPIVSPAGRVVTVDAAERPHGDCDRLLHHRSCWCGWGDVNGVDHWTDAGAAGRQVHRRFTLSASGPVFGRLSALIDWVDARGRPQLAEQRVFTVYAQAGGCRIVDITNRFMMTAGPVTFGDTADGGFCAVRVAAGLAPTGRGVVRNANGDEGMDDCCGAAAAWCGVAGRIDDRPVALTILDFPGNVRYPTFWNVRGDGLLAANPFGLASFLHDPCANGARVFEKDTVVMFRYRIIVHDGSPSPEDIERYSACFTKSLEIVVE